MLFICEFDGNRYREGLRLMGNDTDNIFTNVTLRRVRVTIVGVEKQYVLHILSVCLQTYRLRPVWLYYISTRCLIKGIIFE